MQLYHQHPWDLSPNAAIALQQELAGKIETADRLPEIHRVAEIDVGFEANGGITLPETTRWAHRLASG